MAKSVRCIRIEAHNKIFGNHMFWEGPAEEITTIDNIPARIVAEKVHQDGQYHSYGMWHAFPIGE